jgi:hypothetical protein
MSRTIIVVLLSLVSNFLFSQSERQLLVSIILENDSLYAFDPWHIQIEIKNISTAPIKILPISAEQGLINKLGFVDIQVLLNNDSSWQSTRQIINYHDESACSYILPVNDVMVEIMPNQTISTAYILPPKLTPSSGNFIKLRVEYFIPIIGRNIFSSVQTIYLKNYDEVDNLAYQYLKTLPRPYFLYHPLYNVFYDITDIERAEYLVKHFPKSKFALYAKLFLAQTYFGLALADVQYHKSSTQTLEFLKRCKYFGYAVLDSHEPKFIKKSEDILGEMGGVLFHIYESDPPPALVEEFLYPPKH